MTVKNKAYKSVQFETKDISEKGIVSGVLNYFGNKDYAGDITMKGAFTKSLVEILKSGRDLVVLWQHKHDMPIGIWKNLRETSRGLEGDAHLNLDTVQGREAFALAKQGALSGFSIGYYVIEESYDPSAKANRLHEVSLLETSLVTFPCNDLSRTEGIKMKLKDNVLPTVRELEATLKEAGYSNADAKHIVSKYMPAYVDPEEKAALEAAEKLLAQTTVEALIAKHALKFVVSVAAPTSTEDEKGSEYDDEEKSGEEEDPEQEGKEDYKSGDEEEMEEEKSNSLDAFFTK
jgi:hypothetical protein